MKTALSVTQTSVGPAGNPPVEPLPRLTVQPSGWMDAGDEHQPPFQVPSGLKIEIRPSDSSATQTCLTRVLMPSHAGGGPSGSNLDSAKPRVFGQYPLQVQ